MPMRRAAQSWQQEKSTMNTKTRAGDTATDPQGADSSLGGLPIAPAATVQGPGPAGDGRTPETPIMVDATTSMAGVPAEYAWLKRRFGVMEQDWTVDLRSLGRNTRGRTIETFRVRLKGGSKIDVHFDITGFHQM
jgi:hypothetical protein